SRFQLLIKNTHRLSGKPLVLREIKIAAGGDAFQFLAGQLAALIAFAEGKLEQNVHRRSGVMREFLRLLPILDERGAWQADAFIPADALLDPVFVPRFPAPVRISDFRFPISDFRSWRDAAGNGFDGLIRPDEKLELHLLEFAGAEGVIARI